MVLFNSYFNSSFVFLEQNKLIVGILVKPEINKTYSNKSVVKVDTRIIMIVCCCELKCEVWWVCRA